MRRISATYIYPVSSPPEKGRVILLNDDSSIADILPVDSCFEQEIEYYDGIICPGFVNAHCHTELSHLNGTIEQGRGLHGFLSDLQSIRSSVKFSKSNFENAERELATGGTVAVGDISNGNETFNFKVDSSLIYHTFIEVYGLRKDRELIDFERGKMMLKQARELGLRASLSPHAPYSVLPSLFALLQREDQPVISMHNQESASENEMFIIGTGGLIETFKSFGIDMSRFKPSGKSSLQSVLQFLNGRTHTQLVHNTFTTEEDVHIATEYFDKVYWCCCPSANLYIEGKLPDIAMLKRCNTNITVGTDSYASNTHLSVFEELKLISENFDGIPFQELIRWASLNGAEFLGIQQQIGTIEKGKKPGLNLITQNDILQLAQDSKLIRVA